MRRIIAILAICSTLYACSGTPKTAEQNVSETIGSPSAQTMASPNDTIRKLDSFLSQPLPEEFSKRAVPEPTQTLYQISAAAQPLSLQPARPGESASPNGTLEAGVGLNFDNADIHDVAKVVSEITKKIFIVDTGVEGTVTIYSEQSLTPQQVFDLFKSVLELNGLALTQVGDFYKIVKRETAQQRYLSVDTGNYATPEDKLITQIVKLRYVKGQEVKKALQAFTSGEIIVYPDANGNTLIVTDLASNVKKLLEIIQEMDISQYANQYVEIFPIEHANLEDLLKDLYQILALPGASASMSETAQTELTPAAGAQPQPSSTTTPGTTTSTVAPVVPSGTETKLHAITRLNALMVSTNNPEVLSLVRKWINILDQPSVKIGEAEVSPTEITNHVYPVKYSKADELAVLLTQVYSNATGQQTQQQQTQQQPTQQQAQQTSPLTGTSADEKPPVFTPDKSINSIVIRANAAQYAQILSLLEKLDQRPLQVLIDVLIAEVKLNDSDVFGIQGMLQSEDQLTIGGETNVFNAAAETAFEGIDGGTGFSYVLTAPGRLLTQLRALATESRVKVLSDPHIMVRNNQEANINIGDSIPITKTTGTGDTAETTVEYRETGIILKVKPQINYENDVILEITQEVSSPGTKESGDAAPPITKTSAQTHLITHDGQPLIIGGLISSTGSNSVQGVPLLKDLPLLGRLFRYNEKQNVRKELVILVVPRIVRSAEQGWTLTDDALQKRVQQLEDLFNREEPDAEKVKRFLQRQFAPQK